MIFKKIGMARVIKNRFSEEIIQLEQNNTNLELQKEVLSTKREMKGIFEGNLEEGMLEASQSSGLINDIPTVEQLMKRLISEYQTAKETITI